MFIGRQRELALLKGLCRKNSSSLVVCKGRRRIGKSALIAEFGKEFSRFFSFSGLPPSVGVTHQDQKEAFVKSLSAQTSLPEFKADDWTTIFQVLAKETARGRILILFDEISWMGSKDPTFLPKLKVAWDHFFSKNPHLVFVLCGSISSWIDNNILKSTGFFGRISLELHLSELPLDDCNLFWGSAKDRVSAYEKFCFLGVTGGVPRYLEELHPHLPVETNIRNLCFTKEGILFNELDRIFSDLFSRRASTYKEIVSILAGASLAAIDIFKKLKKEKNGVLLNYLDDLVTSGFISHDYIYKFDGTVSKSSKYRLSDNYLRFYLRYIAPQKNKIIHNDLNTLKLSSLKNWETIMGLQFENLVLNNHSLIKKILDINPEQIISDGPYFQNKTSKNQGGCQIDYLIQLRFNTLYVCEIKFSKNKVGKEIIGEMEKKIRLFSRPKGFSVRPVLITVNGVEESVIEEQYFDKIISFEEMINFKA